jgi:hypothetical protein
MFSKTKLALAATLILGSATVALADSGTDVALDTSRSAGPVVQQQLTTRPVALSRTKAPVIHEQYIDRASQVIDGGAG